MNEARDDEYTTQLDEFEAALKNLLKEQHVDIVKIDSEEYELDKNSLLLKCLLKMVRLLQWQLY